MNIQQLLGNADLCEQVVGDEPIKIPIKINGEVIYITYKVPIISIARVEVFGGSLLPVVEIIGQPDEDGVIYSYEENT